MLSEDGALIDRRNIPSEGERIERKNMPSPGVLKDLKYMLSEAGARIDLRKRSSPPLRDLQVEVQGDEQLRQDDVISINDIVIWLVGSTARISVTGDSHRKAAAEKSCEKGRYWNSMLNYLSILKQSHLTRKFQWQRVRGEAKCIPGGASLSALNSQQSQKLSTQDWSDLSLLTLRLYAWIRVLKRKVVVVPRDRIKPSSVN